jgi:protease IV
MKINMLINEFVKGMWFMHLPALEIYGVLAHKLVSGEKVEFPQLGNQEAKAILNYYDENGKRLRADEDGHVSVPRNSVAVVQMVGPLIKYGDWCTYGADEIVGALDAANSNPNVSSIILDVDGPGGSVSAISPFEAFAGRKTKPVLALVDQCCSAHLYSSLLVADHMMAANSISALIGSIGVVMSWRDNKKYLESLGYEFHEVYPDESEDKNKAFRLAMEGNYDLIKEEMLSPLAIKFQNAVKAARPNLKVNEKGLLTGKTYMADKALDLGLIDSIGDMKQAMQMAMMLGEINRYKN